MLRYAGSWAMSSMSPIIRRAGVRRPAAVPSSALRSSARSSMRAADTARRISSRQTFFVKRVFPVLWFGTVVLSLAAGVAGGRAGKGGPAPGFIVPLLLFVVGYAVMRRLVDDLAAEGVGEGGGLRRGLRADEE